MKRIILMSLFVMVAAVGSVWAQSASVAGEWEGTFNTPGGARPFKAVFSVEGEKLTGTVKRTNGDIPLTGTIKGEDISFSYTITYGEKALTLFFTGKVSGDSMGGNISFGGNTDDSWSAKRVSK